jgi:hypothetical protein
VAPKTRTRLLPCSTYAFVREGIGQVYGQLLTVLSATNPAARTSEPGVSFAPDKKQKLWFVLSRNAAQPTIMVTHLWGSKGPPSSPAWAFTTKPLVEY